MFVVIFRARIRRLDDEYTRMAARMRELALTQFGCLEFQALTEGAEEVALSYWPDEESIRAWKAHPEHVAAQRMGKERWYSPTSCRSRGSVVSIGSRPDPAYTEGPPETRSQPP